MTPTPEQSAICEAVASGQNVMVEALAGCAKSTTIVEASRGVSSAAILAFNVKIKKEMEAKLRAAGLPHKVYTLNGLGHAALLSIKRSLTLDDKKIITLTKEVGLRGDDFSDCLQLVRSARLAGIVPGGLAKGLLPDTDNHWRALADEHDIDPVLTAAAREVLIKSNRLAMQGTIDYDDQLYASVCLYGQYPKFSTIFVDEAQDLSRLNHEQVRRAARAQIVAVGDSHQAIYAWRGADGDSMANLRSLRDSWSDQTLSVTFRCPRRVVERQQAFVPHFRAGPDNLDGTVRSLKDWSPSAGSAVLCRNNEPIIRLAFRLLRNGIPATVLGRDIGKNLKRLFKKLSRDGQRSIADTIEAARREIEADKKQTDRMMSLIALLESQENVHQALDLLSTERAGAVQLATGHRAKGLEWDTVYHLEPGLIPSIYAETELELQQEKNLRYVIETRTRNELNFVRLENFAP